MKFKSRVKKLVVTTGMLLMLGLVGTTQAYAAGPADSTQTQQQVQQSPRWEGSGDTWKVKNQSGTGYLTNSWFQDNDGSWYMLGGDGVMYSGLITDQSTGKSYLLNTNHDGTYGKMLTVDGVYNINGNQVYLQFNQSHDGTYGAIINGLTEIRNIGVAETQLSSIPTDSASGTTQNQQQPQQDTKPKTSPGRINSPGGEVHSSGENWLRG